MNLLKHFGQITGPSGLNTPSFAITLSHFGQIVSGVFLSVAFGSGFTSVFSNDSGDSSESLFANSQVNSSVFFLLFRELHTASIQS